MVPNYKNPEFLICSTPTMENRITQATLHKKLNNEYKYGVNVCGAIYICLLHEHEVPTGLVFVTQTRDLLSTPPIPVNGGGHSTEEQGCSPRDT